jgi:hypothetical protein
MALLLENNELTDMLQMHEQCYHVIRMHLQRPESRKTPFWARLVINLVQRRNGQDRT